MKSETLFRTQKVDPFLKSLKHAYFFSIQQKAIRGTPDKLGVVQGTFVALELKSEKGKVDPLQKFYLKEIEKAGGLAMVVSPQNWDEVKLILTNLSEGGLYT